MAEIELLPCPFCGGKAELEETEREDHYSAPRPHRVYIIECCACDANLKEISQDWWSGSTPPPESENDLKAKSDVIAAWNRRATRHVSDEAVEAGVLKADWHKLGPMPTDPELEDKLGNVKYGDTPLRARAALAHTGKVGVPDAWQYRIKIDGAWSRWMLREHYCLPSKAEEQRPLYLHRAVLAPPDSGVKALEWDGRNAATPFGQYTISYPAENSGVTLVFERSAIGEYVYPDEASAKAAAQADYEARILSALHTGGET